MPNELMEGTFGGGYADILGRIENGRNGRDGGDGGDGGIIKPPDFPIEPVKTFDCSVCGQKFTSPEYLDAHMASAHPKSEYEWDMPWQQPGWFPSSYYAVPGSQWGTEASANIKQAWQRSPEWGGHIVYHPYWGWQDLRSVGGMYEQAKGPVTWEQFKAFGLTPQMGEDWRKWFPDRPIVDFTTGEPTPPSPPSPTYPTGAQPTTWTGEDLPQDWLEQLYRFGYTGPIGLNPYEEEALRFINEIYQTQGPLATQLPAQDYLTQLVSGAFAPTGDIFKQNVYETTKAGAMQTLADIQKQMGLQFAHKGGYFGGKHALSQSLLGERTATSLNEILANLQHQAYQQDIASRLQGSQQLMGLGESQMGIAQNILGMLGGGGQMLTQRELVNRAELQAGMQRAYEDWTRARGEQLAPFDWGQTLLGMQPSQPVVQQGSGAWAQILQSLIGAGGTLGGALIAASSKKFKKDISKVTEEDEEKIFEKIKSTPIFNYRYKFEPETKSLHTGMITEEAPKELTIFDNKAIDLYEYMAFIHAAVKVLARKLKMAEN